MKNKYKIIGISALALSCFAFAFKTLSYDSKFVEISNTTYQGSKYNVIWLKRGESNKAVSAKYFSNQTPTKTVHQRFQDWADQKRIICYSSGTYMDGYTMTSSTRLVGFAVDNGVIQNKNVKIGEMDALVIVYATGGIVCSNLREKNLRIGAIKNNAPLDIRGNEFHRNAVVKWAENENATIFQTHLLAMSDKLLVGSNGNPKVASRRFLAVVNDEDGNLVHAVIHDSNESSIYDASKKIVNYLQNEKEVQKIHWMINLDTGIQDVFGVFNPDGTKNPYIQGKIVISNAANLLIYYQD